MSILASWLLIASVNLAVTMSPGPAFAMTVRAAMIYPRRACLFLTAGLGLGVGVHVALVLGGFAVLLTKSLLLYNILRYAGAAYLFYIGVRALMAKKHAPNETGDARVEYKTITDLEALRMGFLTNLLNPKSMVFFTAVYAQFVAPHTPVEILVLYGTTSALIEFFWFSCVALVLTNARIRRSFLGIAHWIERVCGGLLIALGIRLALSKGLS